MAKFRLNARKVEAAGPGRYCDGQGLWLSVSPTGWRRWIYRFTLNGKTSEVAIGRYPAVTLEAARALAEVQRKLHLSGANPAEVRRRAKELVPVPTFQALTAEFIAMKTPEWKSAIHTRQWVNSMAQHARPIHQMTVDVITVADVLKVLKPVWLATPETASRVRSRIEAVLDYGRAKGHCRGENPARWRGNLAHLLPKQKQSIRGHYTAMNYSAVPSFVSRLRVCPSVSMLALEFLILTATRSSEMRCAEWHEIDFEMQIWTIPGERMKAGKPHRVPLSPRAVEILREMSTIRVGNLVFTGRSGGPLCGSTLNALLKRLKVHCTPHGFRSSFRDWCGDETSFPREIAEAALAHAVGNAVEASYRRSDALERRRQLMNAWASYCEGERTGNVVGFNRSAER